MNNKHSNGALCTNYFTQKVDFKASSKIVCLVTTPNTVKYCLQVVFPFLIALTIFLRISRSSKLRVSSVCVLHIF